MSKKDEALKLALEALDKYGFAPCDKEEDWQGFKRAINAIREALAEPVEWLTGCPECGMDGGCDCDSGTWNPPASKPWVGLTPREIELLDGMIEVQLHHAAQCDRITNRTMAEKQKGWDMERVALLRKLKEKNT